MKVRKKMLMYPGEFTQAGNTGRYGLLELTCQLVPAG
jgi:hypothetical protein